MRGSTTKVWKRRERCGSCGGGGGGRVVETKDTVVLVASVVFSRGCTRVVARVGGGHRHRLVSRKRGAAPTRRDGGGRGGTLP